MQRAVVLSDGVGLYTAAVPRPHVGFYELRLSHPAFGKAVSVIILVTEGHPSRLQVVKEPSPATSNVLELQEQPQLWLLDAADNHVTSPDPTLWGPLVALATAVPTSTDPRAAALPLSRSKNTTEHRTAFKDGFFVFSDVGFVAKYGLQYRLNFSVCNGSGGAEPIRAIQWVMSRPIVAKDCGLDQYYIPLDTECRPCMPGGNCTGGSLHELEVWGECCAGKGLGGGLPACIGGGRARAMCQRKTTEGVRPNGSDRELGLNSRLGGIVVTPPFFLSDPPPLPRPPRPILRALKINLVGFIKGKQCSPGLWPEEDYYGVCNPPPPRTGGGPLGFFFCSGPPLRTAPRDDQPPTATNRQPPPTAHRQPPTIATNHG